MIRGALLLSASSTTKSSTTATLSLSKQLSRSLLSTQAQPQAKQQQRQTPWNKKNTHFGKNKQAAGGGGSRGGNGNGGGGNATAGAKATDDTTNGTGHKQPFVTNKIEPGEWDPLRKDPLYRPKYRSESKIISAEDFANRPMVTFDEEFETYADGMVTLGWLDMATQKQIYNTYINLMTKSHKDHNGRTSHEYVTKLIAQRVNIAPFRVAAVIQLQHNEEQLRLHNPELLCEEQAKYAEDTIKQNINDAYRSENSKPPRHFVEDPVGAHGKGDVDNTSRFYLRSDDIYDLQEKLNKANIRDADRARYIIDNHTYIEDVDDNQTYISVDGNCNKLLKKQETLKKENDVNESKILETSNGVTIPYPETNTEGKSRDRYKFIAQVVDTRKQKIKKHKQQMKTGGRYKNKERIITNYTNNDTKNTLVEQNGTLRVATVEETKNVAWKKVRGGDTGIGSRGSKNNEFIYAGVKRAWLDHTIHNQKNVWGHVLGTKTQAPTGSKTSGKEGTSESKATATEAKATAEEVVEEKEEDAPLAGGAIDETDVPTPSAASAASDDVSEQPEDDSKKNNDQGGEESKEK